MAFGAIMKPISSLIASRETVVVAGGTSVADAARLMTDHHIGAVPVLEADRVVGIFTERDIMSRVVAAGRDPRRTIVTEVMTTDLIVADVQETYQACLRRMQQARVRHIIVLREGRLAGILSLRDLFACDLDEKEEAINLLNAYVHYIPADLSREKI